MANGVKGLDKLMKKYGDLATAAAGPGLIKAVGASTKLIRAEASDACLVKSGELKQKIRISTEQQDEKVIGTVYTNVKYAPYIEFGTGPKGEKNHEGISPLVTPVYSQSPWWIHESQIDVETAEKYHWFYIDTKKGRFYQCSGQAAQPFLYPALKNNEDRVTRNISNYVAREIRKACN